MFLQDLVAGLSVAGFVTALWLPYLDLTLEMFLATPNAWIFILLVPVLMIYAFPTRCMETRNDTIRYNMGQHWPTHNTIRRSRSVLVWLLSVNVGQVQPILAKVDQFSYVTHRISVSWPVNVGQYRFSRRSMLVSYQEWGAFSSSVWSPFHLSLFHSGSYRWVAGVCLLLGPTTTSIKYPSPNPTREHHDPCYLGVLSPGCYSERPGLRLVRVSSFLSR